MSSVIHICTVCFEPSESHREDEDFMECGCEERHFPPLCCPGCDCGSYEAAHAETPPEPPAEGDLVDA